MIKLFHDTGPNGAPNFLEKNKGRVTLLASPRFVTELFYVEKQLQKEGKGIRFSVSLIDANSLTSLESNRPVATAL